MDDRKIAEIIVEKIIIDLDIFYDEIKKELIKYLCEIAPHQTKMHEIERLLHVKKNELIEQLSFSKIEVDIEEINSKGLFGQKIETYYDELAEKHYQSLSIKKSKLVKTKNNLELKNSSNAESIIKKPKTKLQMLITQLSGESKEKKFIADFISHIEFKNMTFSELCSAIKINANSKQGIKPNKFKHGVFNRVSELNETKHMDITIPNIEQALKINTEYVAYKTKLDNGAVGLNQLQKSKYFSGKWTEFEKIYKSNPLPYISIKEPKFKIVWYLTIKYQNLKIRQPFDNLMDAIDKFYEIYNDENNSEFKDYLIDKIKCNKNRLAYLENPAVFKSVNEMYIYHKESKSKWLFRIRNIGHLESFFTIEEAISARNIFLANIDSETKKKILYFNNSKLKTRNKQLDNFANSKYSILLQSEYQIKKNEFDKKKPLFIQLIKNKYSVMYSLNIPELKINGIFGSLKDAINARTIAIRKSKNERLKFIINRRKLIDYNKRNFTGGFAEKSRNIFYDEASGVFIFRKVINNVIYTISTHTFEEAIGYKDEWLLNGFNKDFKVYDYNF